MDIQETIEPGSGWFVLCDSTDAYQLPDSGMRLLFAATWADVGSGHGDRLIVLYAVRHKQNGIFFAGLLMRPVGRTLDRSNFHSINAAKMWVRAQFLRPTTPLQRARRKKPRDYP